MSKIIQSVTRKTGAKRSTSRFSDPEVGQIRWSLSLYKFDQGQLKILLYDSMDPDNGAGPLNSLFDDPNWGSVTVNEERFPDQTITSDVPGNFGSGYNPMDWAGFKQKIDDIQALDNSRFMVVIIFAMYHPTGGGNGVWKTTEPYDNFVTSQCPIEFIGGDTATPCTVQYIFGPDLNNQISPSVNPTVSSYGFNLENYVPPPDVFGCTDPDALNFNPDANVDDGSCYWFNPDPNATVFGCTDPNANNFNPAANFDDNSCEYDPEPEVEDTFRIELWNNNQLLAPIATGVTLTDSTNQGSYSWVVPNSLGSLVSLPADCEIRVYYEQNEYVYGTTDLFAIHPTYSDVNEIINLELVTPQGLSIGEPIVQNTDNDGSYVWTVSNTIASGYYRIKASVSLAPFANTLSNLFEIINTGTELTANTIVQLSTVKDDVNFSNISDRIRIATGIENRPIIYQHINRNFFGTTGDSYLYQFNSFHGDEVTPEPAKLTPGKRSSSLFASGGGNGTFMNGKYAFYKFVPVYDGIQESLFPNDFVSEANTSVADSAGSNPARAELTLKFNLSDWNPRITHINIYRAIQDTSFAENSVYYKIDSIDTRSSFGTAAQSWESATGRYFSNGANSWTQDAYSGTEGHVLLMLKGYNSFGYLGGSGAFNVVNEDEHSLCRSDSIDSIFAEMDSTGGGGGSYLRLESATTISASSGSIRVSEENHVLLNSSPTWNDWNESRSSYFIHYDATGFLLFRDGSNAHDSGKLLTGNWNTGVTWVDDVADAATNANPGVEQTYTQDTTKRLYERGENGVKFTLSLADTQKYLLSFRMYFRPHLDTHLNNISNTDKIFNMFNMDFVVCESTYSTDFTDVSHWKEVLRVKRVPRSFKDSLHGNDANDRYLQFTTTYTASSTASHQFWAGFVGESNGTSLTASLGKLRVHWQKIVFAKVDAENSKSFIGSKLTAIPDSTFFNETFRGATIKTTQTQATGEVTEYVVAEKSYNNLIQLPSSTFQWDGSTSTAANGTIESTIDQRGWTESNNQITLTYTDWGLPNKTTHPYESSSSIQVNYTYSKYMAGRLFVAGVRLGPDLQKSEDHTDWVMFSELNKPDVLPISNYIAIEDVQGGDITGLAELVGDLAVFMTNGIFRLDIPKADPRSWSLIESEKNIGCNAPKSIVPFEGGVFFAGKEAFYLLDSNFQARKLSEQIKDIYIQYHTSDTEAMFAPNKNDLYVSLGGDSNSFILKLSLTTFPESIAWSKIPLGSTAKFSSTGLITGSHSIIPSAMAIDELNAPYLLSTELDGSSYNSKIYELEPGTALSSDILYGETPQDNPNLINSARENVGFSRKTGWVQIGDLENTSTIRRISLLYSSVDYIRLKLYVDGNLTPAFETIFDGSRDKVVSEVYYSILAPDISKTAHVRVGIRAKFVQIELSSDPSTFPVSIKKISLEVD
tara:strand:- start:5742 stop:10043 length:4302 start_codon:yes stop_codon:yes gene_type:complete